MTPTPHTLDRAVDLSFVPALFLALVLALCLAHGILAAPANAQEPRGLSALAGGGYEHGGPGPSLAVSLEAAGLGGNHYEGSGYLAEYPQHYAEGLGLVYFLGGHYRFDGPFSIDAVISNGSRGHAMGYGSTSTESIRLLLRWSAVAVTSTAGVHLGPIRLAAGPSVNIVFWDTERNWHNVRSFATPVPGITATAAARIPLRDALLSVSVGVRSFATMDLEPYLDLPLDTRYGTWFAGITVMPTR